MELRVLRYFLVVAQEENITQAAKKLHLTQPTLSRQMMLLEQELGVTLFDRGRRRISLTASGLLLRERAAALLALSDKTVEDLASQEETLAGGGSCPGRPSGPERGNPGPGDGGLSPPLPPGAVFSAALRYRRAPGGVRARNDRPGPVERDGGREPV